MERLKMGGDAGRLAGLLACPDCRSPLTVEQGAPAPCPECGRTFEMHLGVPILHPWTDRGTAEAGRRFFIEEPGRMDTLRRSHPRLAALLRLPDFTTPSTALPECRRWFREHIDPGGAAGPVLNLGSGVEKVYAGTGLVNFDIAPHGNADVVGDGERLPFRDAVFEGALLDAVIEHLPRPRRVIDEVRRVLKPGGMVLAQVPFLYPFHAAPHDYRRYTPAGLTMLFEEFETVEAGSDRRPGRAVLEVLSAYAATWSDGRGAAYALRWLTAWAWLPIKFFDPYLARKSKADAVTASSSILARKPC